MKRVVFLLASIGAAIPATAQNGVPIGIDFGVFFPTNNEVRQVFGESWWRTGITPLGFQRPENWKATFDIAYLSRRENGNNVTLIPFTFGVTKSFGNDPNTRPYVAVRVGPYYGDVSSPFFGVDTTKIGFDANASVGVVFGNMFYIEGRYDWFSDFEDLDFSGFFISAGFRLFEIRI